MTRLGFGKINLQTKHGELVFAARVDVEEHGYPIHWTLVLPVKHRKEVKNKQALRNDDVIYLVTGLVQIGFSQDEVKQIKDIIAEKAKEMFPHIVKYRENPPDRLPKAKRW